MTAHPFRPQHYGIAIHGGAGAILGNALSAASEAAYFGALNIALDAAYAILRDGGCSLDAVSAAVVVLEDSPLFNAGRGAVFNADGDIELDAAIMDGRNLSAGAVAAARTPKNPILLARAVMEHGGHVMLCGAGADAFAQAQGFQAMPPQYFYTQDRWQALEDERARLRDTPAQASIADLTHGTVGAVALDADGNLAAATSTGGRTHKLPGRVGDSPGIGAGTYAANDSCAVSATGHGEFFMRGVIAYDIAARMRYTGNSLADAADASLAQTLDGVPGSGGLIAIDRLGHIVMPFNTERMYRGFASADGTRRVAIYP